MSDFDEILIQEICFGTLEGKMYVNGDVLFHSSKPLMPEISVKISVDVEETDTVASVRTALAMKATRLLRELSSLPDETIQSRLQSGARSYEDRVEEHSQGLHPDFS